MYSETWNKYWCPHCDRANWLYLGDLNDFSGFSPEGFQCWKCKVQVPLTDYPPQPGEDGEEEEEESYHFEPGSRSPINKKDEY